MDAAAIRAKFGGDYVADERTFVMGIDHRLASHIAGRFHNFTILETCTGAGFTTIALAQAAKHVVTVDVNPAHQEQARHNVATAGLAHRVTFVVGDILNDEIWNSLPAVNAAFLDPDWAITGPDHVHRFKRSTMLPPADTLLPRVLQSIPAAAIVLPPQIDVVEFVSLPAHEREKLHLDGSHELYCLYFGSVARVTGETECWL